MFGCIAVGMILLTQFCTLLCISSAALAWAALKSKWQRKRSIRHFRKELKRQGIPEDLIKRMAKQYGKTVDWFEVFKFFKKGS
ncbi:MAG: RecX family transcriptional regulator [Armatimonadetes bacterium]|nr:RecX family transcriptional regulator [Armatimonadota bacterium]